LPYRAARTVAVLDRPCPPGTKNEKAHDGSGLLAGKPEMESDAWKRPAYRHPVQCCGSLRHRGPAPASRAQPGAAAV